jgi:lipoic acid synthetase
VRGLLGRLRLHTVCQSAHCPNLCECFASGTATFLILGNVCTRHCRFCAVAAGEPQPLEADEPDRVAQAAATLGLRHVVVTSVTRDDLPDGGSGQFAATIAAIHAACEATVEVLTPDFQGRADLVARVLAAGPEVFNHNVETVPRLYPAVRPEADYRRSLDVLRLAHEHGGPLTKSGLMLGLGETRAEVLAVLRDLRAAGCEALTLGQYLRPSAGHLPVDRFVTPSEFGRYERDATELGFLGVAAGPFVRSSYHAEGLLGELATARRSR